MTISKTAKALQQKINNSDEQTGFINFTLQIENTIFKISCRSSDKESINKRIRSNANAKIGKFVLPLRKDNFVESHKKAMTLYKTEKKAVDVITSQLKRQGFNLNMGTSLKHCNQFLQKLSRGHFVSSLGKDQYRVTEHNSVSIISDYLNIESNYRGTITLTKKQISKLEMNGFILNK